MIDKTLMGTTLRERRREQTRRAILDAALELTRDGGRDGWTMRELADRIDFTTTATYRYFAGKDALLEALVEDALASLRDELQGAFDAVDPDAEPLDVVVAVALAYLDFARTNPTGFRLALIDQPSRRTSLDGGPDRRSAYTVLFGAVVGAVEAGELTATVEFGPEQIAFTIWSTIHGMAVLETTHLEAFAPQIQAAAERGIRALLAGLASDH